MEKRTCDYFTVVEDMGHILDWKGTVPVYVVKQFFFDEFKAALVEGNLAQKKRVEVGNGNIRPPGHCCFELQNS